MKNIIAIFLTLCLCFAISAFGETRLFPQAAPNPDVSNTESQQEQIPQNSLPNAIIESDIESQNMESQSSDSIQYSNKSLVKNVYLETLTPLLDILYVHQVVALEVKMLIFSEYTTIETEFLFEDNALKNRSSAICDSNY